MGGAGGAGAGAGGGGGGGLGGNTTTDPNLQDLSSTTPASAQSCPAGSSTTPAPTMSSSNR